MVELIEDAVKSHPASEGSPPIQAVIQKAAEWGKKFQELAGTSWQPPLVETHSTGEISFQWWNPKTEKAGWVYLDAEFVGLLWVWGETDDDMEYFHISSPEEWQSMWEWLNATFH